MMTTESFKIGDKIIWPIGNLPGTIIAAGVKTYMGRENCFVAHVPKLHTSYDGIVYIREDGRTIDGTPVSKPKEYRYANVWYRSRLSPTYTWFDTLEQAKRAVADGLKHNLARLVGRLRGELVNDTLINIEVINCD